MLRDIIRIKWQKPMVGVLQALAPIMVASVYWFGWRSLVMLLLVNAAAYLTEYCFLRPYKEPVTSAVLVTGSLLALSLPPTLPLWMAVVGTVFGVAFGKMVFGGFGRNPYNPAMVGRAFLYICFAVYMNAHWTAPYSGFPGGFGAYASDAVTGATPLRLLKQGVDTPWPALLIGNTAGCYGETSILLVLLGGLYLVIRKFANYRIVVGGLLGMIILQAILWKLGVPRALDPWRSLLTGSFLFGLFFFATEPVSGPATDLGRWLYGIFFGSMTVLIRAYSSWEEGTMFAILLANTFAPIVDVAIKAVQQRQKGSAGAA